LALSLLLLLSTTACFPVKNSDPAPSTGSLYGTVLTSADAPAIGAYVYAYKSNDKGLRGPADFAARVDLDGRYVLDVVSGAYHLIARQRQSGGGSGPPRAGDAWAVYPKNPIRIVGSDNGPADFMLQQGTGLHQVRQGVWPRATPVFPEDSSLLMAKRWQGRLCSPIGQQIFDGCPILPRFLPVQRVNLYSMFRSRGATVWLRAGRPVVSRVRGNRTGLSVRVMTAVDKSIRGRFWRSAESFCAHTGADQLFFSSSDSRACNSSMRGVATSAARARLSGST